MKKKTTKCPICGGLVNSELDKCGFKMAERIKELEAKGDAIIEAIKTGPLRFSNSRLTTELNMAMKAWESARAAREGK